VDHHEAVALRFMFDLAVIVLQLTL